MVPDAKKFFRLIVGQENFIKYNNNADGIKALILGNVKEAGKMKKQSDKFQFTLTNKQGFVINAGTNILVTEQGKVNPSYS